MRVAEELPTRLASGPFKQCRQEVAHYFPIIPAVQQLVVRAGK